MKVREYTNTYFSDDYFTIEKTYPVRFFYKLPSQVRRICEELYEDIFGPECFTWLQNNKDVGDFYMKNISIERFKYIRNNTQNVDYLVFLEYYKLLQPVIKNIIDANDLYEKYPEYLI